LDSGQFHTMYKGAKLPVQPSAEIKP